jgi:prophage DNA circulation protein
MMPDMNAYWFLKTRFLQGAGGTRLSKQLLLMYKDMHQDMEEAKALLTDLKGQVASIKAAGGGTGDSVQQVKQLVEPAAAGELTKTLQESMEATKSMLADMKAQIAAMQAASTGAVANGASAATATGQQAGGGQGLPDKEQASAAALSKQSEQEADVAQAGSAAGQPICADTCFKVSGKVPLRAPVVSTLCMPGSNMLW